MQIHIGLLGPAAGAFYREASILAASDDGRRHASFIAACRLGKFVAHDVSGHDQVEPASLVACDASGAARQHGRADALGAIRRMLDARPDHSHTVGSES